jgi:hypothetical protein
MTDDLAECLCVVDTSGLHAIAVASGNIQSVLIDKLKCGIIGVPTCAWSEFEELYDLEAVALAPSVSRKIIGKKATQVMAARIAEKLNSGFSRGAYDQHTEIYTAAIAASNAYRVLTSVDQLSRYASMGCSVVDIEAWVAEFDD